MSYSIAEIKNVFVQYSDKNAKKIFYTPSKQVSEINSPYIQELIVQMKEKMDGVGIGLSANQLGHPIQLFIIEYIDDKREPRLNMQDIPFQVFINPKITKASKEKISFWHGCLSALDKPKGKIATYKWIEYEAFDHKGNLKKGKLEGMGSIIFQHEFWHLLGYLYINHAKEFLESDILQSKVKSGNIQLYKPASKEDPFLLADYVIGESIEQYASRYYVAKKKNITS